MDKFHYNPVSLNSKTVKFFPNIETLHCYEKKEEYLKGGRINQYVDWRRRTCQEIEEIKKENSGKIIEFKHLIFTNNDVRENTRKQNSENHLINQYTTEIPNGIK